MSLNKGLVGHWRLDEESFNPATKRFTDQSAYCNHGTGNGTQLGSATPGFQTDRMGQLVRAAPFNGSDDYINCGFYSSLSFTDSDEWSNGHWIKWDGSAENFMFYIGKNSSAKNLTLRQNSNNRFGFRDKNSTYYLFAEDSSNLCIDTWTYLEWVADGTGNLSLYINGVFLDTLTSVPTEIDFRFIGRGYSSNIYMFNGNMSDIRIYNRALSQQEITLLYESYRV